MNGNNKVIPWLVVIGSILWAGLSVGAENMGGGIEHAVKATVAITLYDEEDRKIASGSGFILPDGRVATNYHVLQDGYRVEVVSSTGELLLVADHMEAFSSKYDLAILPKVSKSPARLSLSLSKPRIGVGIYAIGAPLGFQNTVSDGIVSAYRAEEGANLMQITAPISPGSSGGPVIGADGLVAGVAVATIRGGQNLNFAVPVEALQSLIRLPVGKTYISARRRAAAEPVVVEESGLNAQEASGAHVAEPPVSNTSPSDAEVVPEKVEPSPPPPPASMGKFAKYEITLKKCRQVAVSRVSCDLVFQNTERNGNPGILSFSSTYIEQAGGRSQDRVEFQMPRLSGVIAWHSGVFCIIQPLGECPISFTYSGVNLDKGAYGVIFRLREGHFGKRTLVSLPAVIE